MIDSPSKGLLKHEHCPSDLQAFLLSSLHFETHLLLPHQRAELRLIVQDPKPKRGCVIDESVLAGNGNIGDAYFTLMSPS